MKKNKKTTSVDRHIDRAAAEGVIAQSITTDTEIKRTTVVATDQHGVTGWLKTRTPGTGHFTYEVVRDQKDATAFKVGANLEWEIDAARRAGLTIA